MCKHRAAAKKRAGWQVAGEWKLNRIRTFKSSVGATESTAAVAFSPRRNMTALYAEGIVPLLGADTELRHAHRLELYGGVRDEIYSDVGHAIAPRVGLSYWAIPDVSLRAGWQQLFRPPNLSDMSEISNVSSIVRSREVYALRELGRCGKLPGHEDSCAW
jgi:outer membrane receptor for ferrienterochelin and colicin